MELTLSIPMKCIKKVKLKNFRRFEEFNVEFDDKLNIIVGDNEAGKSSIIEAIDLVLSGSRSKIDTLGLMNLFNTGAILSFLSGAKRYEDLPTLFIELYFNEQNNPQLNGRNNSDTIICDGLRLEIVPNNDDSVIIRDILGQSDPVFPFEFYSIKFHTFSGDAYSGYKKFFRHIKIDNAQISGEYAVKEFVKSIYDATASPLEKNKHQNEYRKSKERFKTDVLSDINTRVVNYDFTIKSNSKANLESDLTLLENDILIENKGKGLQCFIKTNFALQRAPTNLDFILLEEPENHLSHVKMKELIQEIAVTTGKQLFLTTHSNMICSRLGLNNLILLNSNTVNPLLLKDVDQATSKFFMKAPDNNLLEFIMSNKVLLVEGDAEYILLEALFNKIKGGMPESFGVHIISVNGTSFPKYLDIGKELKIKTAVIRDNDSDFQKKCVDRYMDYICDFIKIFFESDNTVSTFEISMYNANKTICDELFGDGRLTLTVQQYMLAEKTEAAYELLVKKESELVTPEYINQAIVWISA